MATNPRTLTNLTYQSFEYKVQLSQSVMHVSKPFKVTVEHALLNNTFWYSYAPA